MARLQRSGIQTLGAAMRWPQLGWTYETAWHIFAILLGLAHSLALPLALFLSLSVFLSVYTCVCSCGSEVGRWGMSCMWTGCQSDAGWLGGSEEGRGRGGDDEVVQCMLYDVCVHVLCVCTVAMYARARCFRFRFRFVSPFVSFSLCVFCVVMFCCFALCEAHSRTLFLACCVMD